MISYQFSPRTISSFFCLQNIFNRQIMEAISKKYPQNPSDPATLKPKDLQSLKITNITFSKQDSSSPSEFDLLINLRSNAKSPNLNTPFKVMMMNKDKDFHQEIAVFPKRKHAKCSHQTKISEMFFVKSMNLANKPSKLAKDDCKENLGDRDRRKQKNLRSTQYKFSGNQSSSLNKTKSVLNLASYADKQKRAALQPLKRNHSSLNCAFSHNNLNDLKRSSILVQEGSTNIQGRSSQSEKEKDRNSPLINQSQNLKPSPSIKVSENIHFKLQHLTTVKDTILETKLTKYWQDLERTAELHKIQLSALQYSKTPIKYFLGRGNNSRLIRDILKKRWWWTQSQDKNAPDVYFTWLQLKDKTFYQTVVTRKKPSKSSDSFQTVQTGLASSINLNDSLSTMPSQRKCRQNGQNKSHSFMLHQGQSPILRKQSKLQTSNSERSQQHTPGINQSFQGICSSQNIQNLGIPKILRNKPIRHELAMHNHYKHNEFLGNKKALYYNMRQFYQNKGLNVFDFLPLTFHVHSTENDQQFQMFRKTYDAQTIKNKKKRLWILKPGENSNRGRGITIHSDIEEIISIIENTVEKSSPALETTPNQIPDQEPSKDLLNLNHNINKHRTFIVQQYIERPFLYNRRKFDIRCFILLTSLNGLIKGYWYRDGYIRTSCFEFSLDSFSNSLVHLTNDAIQKNCEEYGKYEAGNKLSFQTFKRYLAFKYPKKEYNFDTQVYDKIKNVAIDSIKAAYHMLSEKSSSSQHTIFQIFGLDFMIDENFHPWLIEVNTNPCLETSCSVLQKIIPKMLDDAFKLSIDVVYPPPEQWPTAKRHYLGSTGNNNFQLVFQEEPEKFDQGMSEVNSEGVQGGLKRYQVQGIGEIEEDDQIYQEEEE